MRVVMTLLVRDEADVVDAQIAYHLSAGVDFVVATDHRSSDGTTEILESYADERYLRLFREEGARIDQERCVTRMARLAATEHEADWVLNSDADEFWWPLAGSLKDALAAVPEPFGVVHGVVQTFVPQIGAEGFFAERLVVRLAPVASINDPATSYRPVAKAAHRAHPEVVVGRGNHEVSGMPYEVLHGSQLFELLHFPFRTREQVERKFANKGAHAKRNERGDFARARAISEQGRGGDFIERVAVDPAALESGFDAGLLVEDTRLRDALRLLRTDEGGVRRFATPRRVPTLEPAVPSVEEEVRTAVDQTVLAEAHVVRLARAVDELDRDVHAADARLSRQQWTLPVLSGATLTTVLLILWVVKAVVLHDPDLI